LAVFIGYCPVMHVCSLHCACIPQAVRYLQQEGLVSVQPLEYYPFIVSQTAYSIKKLTIPISFFYQLAIFRKRLYWPSSSVRLYSFTYASLASSQHPRNTL